MFRESLCFYWRKECFRCSTKIFCNSLVCIRTVSEKYVVSLCCKIVPLSEFEEKFRKEISSYSSIESNISGMLVCSVPHISRRCMIIHDTFCFGFGDEPVRKTTRTDNNYIVVTEIETLDTSRHERQAESLFFCEIIYFLSWEFQALLMDVCFWKNTSYFFLIVYECVEIRFWKYFQQAFNNFFSSPELDEHLMEDCDFHGSMNDF